MTLVSPQYGERSLEMVFPSVASRLGVPGYADTFNLPDADRWVVIVIDGLGYELIADHGADAPFLSRILDRDPVRCGLPSTTATSLTSLGTGLAPGAHGVVGYTCRVPETGARLNSLSWDQNIDPLAWQPYPTMLEKLAQSDIATSVVNDSEFAESGLTRCAHRGVPYIGVDSPWERVDAIVESTAEAPAVVYAYEPRLDHTGHKFGCQSQEWVDMLTTIDADMEHIARCLDPGVGLIITADHGMVDISHENRFDVAMDSPLRQDVTLLAGEARFRHLYTRAGAEFDVARRWQETLGDRGIVRTRQDAQGWFGQLTSHVTPRIGDVLVAAVSDFAVFSTAEFAHEHKMTGFHGSLTESEMLIPLMVAVS